MKRTVLFISILLLALAKTFAGGAPFWSTTGNSNTTGTTNFLGTINNQPLVIKTNNTERMRIMNTTGNVGIGIISPVDRLQIGFGDTRIGEINPASSGTFPNYGRKIWFSGGPSGSAAKANTGENPGSA